MRLPVSGHPLHTRSLGVALTALGDGRLRARGTVLDVRKASFVPMADELQTAGVIHQMSLDARLDAASRVIEDLQVAQPAVAVEPSQRTAGESCRDPAPRLQALVGRAFDSALPGELSRVFGGPRGCSHLLTLFHLMASALPRALDFERDLQRSCPQPRRPAEVIFRRSVCVDGHDPGREGLQLAVSLMDYHSAPLAGAVERLDLLARHHEVRLMATLSLADVAIAELCAAERERSRASLAGADWRDRGDAVGDLVGRPILPGLGAELRRRLGGRPEDALLRDALLQLAPAFVQCVPALADDMLVRFAAGGDGGGSGRRPPAFLGFGGNVDSCYMWRSGSPLLQIRPRPSGEPGS